MSATGKQTSAEIEESRIKSVMQNAVVRVVRTRSDQIKSAIFRTQPSSQQLTNQQFVNDCLKHPEKFAEGGPKRSQSRTWLHQLIFLQDIEAINSLIKAGQDVNAVDDLGRTVLHYAAAVGSRPIVEVLLKKGSFKDVELPDKAGYRPLHLASEGGYHGVIHALIKEGEADVNSQGPDGFQPLHLICQAGRSVACFHALLTVGEKLDLKDEDMYGRTPIDILREIMGKGNKRSNEAQAVRKDKRGPWKLLNAAFSHEIKRRKDVKYLRYQEIEEKEKQKQIAKEKLKKMGEQKVAKAMEFARAAFERGETVDWAALGLDPDMEDELMALMANDDDDDDDDDDDEEEEEEEEDDDSEDDEDEGEDGKDGGEEPRFPQDYIDGSGGGGEAGKLQMAAMAMTLDDEQDEDEDDAGKGDDGDDGQHGKEGKGAEKKERDTATSIEEEVEDADKTGLLEETLHNNDDSDNEVHEEENEEKEVALECTTSLSLKQMEDEGKKEVATTEDEEKKEVATEEATEKNVDEQEEEGGKVIHVDKEEEQLLDY